MFRLTLFIAICVSLMACATIEVPVAQWGAPAAPNDIPGISLTILPNGEGLPDGKGDARTGAVVYATHCQSCHGAEGNGGIGGALAGGQGTLASEMPLKTVGSYWPYSTTLFDYVRRAMPYGAPMSLSTDQYYSLTAYVLFINDIIREDEGMDRQSLPMVRMPNRDGFTRTWSGHD